MRIKVDGGDRTLEIQFCRLYAKPTWHIYINRDCRNRTHIIGVGDHRFAIKLNPYIRRVRESNPHTLSDAGFQDQCNTIMRTRLTLWEGFEPSCPLRQPRISNPVRYQLRHHSLWGQRDLNSYCRSQSAMCYQNYTMPLQHK